MNTDVFKIAEVNNDVVVVEVKKVSPIIFAKNPYIDSSISFISVTRGKTHVLTAFDENGKEKYNFFWGEGGHTCISGRLELLKKEIVDFIVGKNHIPLGLNSNVVKAKVLFNHNFGAWQVTVSDGMLEDYIRCDSIISKETAMEYAEKLLGRKANFIDKIAPTGINLWEAQ